MTKWAVALPWTCCGAMAMYAVDHIWPLAGHPANHAYLFGAVSAVSALYGVLMTRELS